MLGLLINDQEHKELVYLVKKELEELLFDMEDYHIDETVKQAMQKRYHTLFQLLRRVATGEECFEYMPKKSEYE